MQPERSHGIVDYVRPVEGWHVVRVVAALVFFIAAATKCHQCCTGPIPGTGLFSAKWFVICLVEAEWLGTVGLLLLAGILAKPAWCAALACFGAFTLVSLSKGLMGEASCGCFGRWELNPFLTATMDAAIVVSLLYWRPKRVAADSGKMFARALCMLLVWLAVGLPAAYVMGSYTETTLSDAGEIIGGGGVVLEPERWIGKRFPLLDYIDIGDKLKEGKWLVMLCQCACPKCQRAIEDLPHVARELDVQQIALIEVSANQKPIGLPAIREVTVTRGHLTDAIDWFAELPVTSLLDGGMVVLASKGGSRFGQAMVANENVELGCVVSHSGYSVTSGS